MSRETVMTDRPLRPARSSRAGRRVRDFLHACRRSVGALCLLQDWRERASWHQIRDLSEGRSSNGCPETTGVAQREERS
jgi:hypothetical protein